MVITYIHVSKLLVSVYMYVSSVSCSIFEMCFQVLSCIHERAHIYANLFVIDCLWNFPGKSFCAGYEQALSSKDSMPMPMFTDGSDGEFQRNTLAGWFMIMDLSKPVIAQVHGACLSAGSELASACDLVYVTPSASIGYPEVRNYGLPDMQMYPWLTGMRNALAIMLLAETMDGATAVQRGWATAVYPEEEIEAKVLARAQRVAKIPADLLAYNKRSVHRAFEAQGMRTNLRHGTDLEALMWHSSSAQILRRAETLYLRKSPTNRLDASTAPKSKPLPVRPPARQAAPAKAPKARSPPAPATKQTASKIASKAGPPRPQAKAEIKRPPPLPPASQQTTPLLRPAPVGQAASPLKSVDSSRLPSTPPVSNLPVSPAVVAKANAIAPTPASNATTSDGTGEGIFIHINKPIAIHIHQSEEPQSKL